MRKIIVLLLVLVAATACGTSRRVARSQEQPWVGSSTLEILEAMGDPDRIDGDGKDGSVLVYESAPDYDDPEYDLLDPDASARKRTYAYFYLDSEGECYGVETNRSLPLPPSSGVLVRSSLWADLIFGLIVAGSIFIF